MKNIKYTLLILLGLLLLPTLSNAQSIADRLKGRILLQVEQNGEAWYVHPDNGARYFMKDGSTAYQMMRDFGLGISDNDLALIPSVNDVDSMKTSTSSCDSNALAQRLKGKILLQVEQLGEAWYLDPVKCHRIYMKNGDFAYSIMRFLGLGITNVDLITLPENSNDDPIESKLNNTSVQGFSVYIDDHIKGDLDAKVTIIEYGDFECPFCGRSYPTVQQILNDYPDDVRLVYRHFPLSFHTHAQKAAEASECAADQGKFWEYHDKIFENQTNLSLGTTQLKSWATELDLNQNQFNICLNSGEKASLITADLKLGSLHGVNGTPSFLVNGQAIVGAQPYSVFQSKIDSILDGTNSDPVEEIPVEDLPSREIINTDFSVYLSDHTRGSSNAKVTIIEYADFQDPYSGKAYTTMKQILATYSSNVRVVYRQYPLSFYPNAQKAAEASECAADQGKFWEYHDKVFENQANLPGGEYQLLTWALELGLNHDDFANCLTRGEKVSAVSSDFDLGTAQGIVGTPGFFVNGQLVSGAQSFDIFQQVIEQELAK